MDNETGEIVIDKITYPGHQARWESDGALLLNHRADGEGNAVVRLDVADDSYELATEVLPDPNHEDGTPPYSLGNTTIWPF